jgi:hypothetical protein
VTLDTTVLYSENGASPLSEESNVLHLIMLLCCHRSPPFDSSQRLSLVGNKRVTGAEIFINTGLASALVR